MKELDGHVLDVWGRFVAMIVRRLKFVPQWRHSHTLEL